MAQNIKIDFFICLSSGLFTHAYRPEANAHLSVYYDRHF